MTNKLNNCRIKYLLWTLITTQERGVRMNNLQKAIFCGLGIASYEILMELNHAFKLLPLSENWKFDLRNIPLLCLGLCALYVAKFIQSSEESQSNQLERPVFMIIIFSFFSLLSMSVLFLLLSQFKSPILHYWWLQYTVNILVGCWMAWKIYLLAQLVRQSKPAQQS